MIPMQIKKMINNHLYNRRFSKTKKMWNRLHLREINEACKQNDITLHEQPGEKEWLQKWSRLSPHVSVEFYRFYSNFIGCDPNIVPDDIFHAIIDPIINDKVSLPVYLNKNLYEILISEEAFPTCVIRKMNGDYMDKDYNDIMMDDSVFESRVIGNKRLISKGRLIVKPTLETGRGRGVHLFCFKEGKWTGENGHILTLDYLEKEYGGDFIIQECIEPSSFVRQFNPTSYSTCRIYTYRSVLDGTMHFLGGYLRVGDVGSFKDNIGSGGFAIPIFQDGSLAPFASNGSRNKFYTINGVNLKTGKFIVPNFDKVLSLAFMGAKRIPLDRVLSFDILLDKYDNPHIVEFNLRAQTIITMQTTCKSFFGEYTDEIIEYCLNKLKNGYSPVFSNYLKKRK